MAREIPEVVRAAAGLAATVLDEARKLPETLPGLPVRVIGLAMQSAMKVQQQYAGFVARGDELFTGLRGEDEPGLATFDEDLDDSAPAARPGYRESAFDRADIPLAEAPRSEEPADEAPVATAPAADRPARKKAAKAAKAPRRPQKATAASEAEEGAEQVGVAQAALDALPAEAPSTEEVLEELAIDEMVGDAPAAGPATATEPDVTADVATTADVLTPDGQVATVEASVTDEGVAAPETLAEEAGDTATDESGTPVAAATGVRTDVGGPDTAEEDAAIAAGAAVDAVGAASATPTDDPEGGSELSGSQAAGTAPIEGYDSFSIAQLRGRLRGYALPTVVDLVAYEEATRAREPYLRMLRNRLEKLEEQAVAASPLAPRGA